MVWVHATTPTKRSAISSTKYIGMDAQKESVSIAVRNAAGKIVMECVIETKASMILQFFILLVSGFIVAEEPSKAQDIPF
jgi:hypothetical protein